MERSASFFLEEPQHLSKQALKGVLSSPPEALSPML